ncbi:ATP-binding protein [Limisphaera sp. 4302-co]|uniref:ATP-binding protein n=1 Tax=Limisphaera sp. 4302-co TaxID=3400417 RepID=UPI003C20D959
MPKSLADIKVWLGKDRLQVRNRGDLAPPLRPEDLRGPHRFAPRNPLLAQAFHFAGFIERCRTGTTRILQLCREQRLPDPEFSDWLAGVRVVFSKGPYTAERLQAIGLSGQQIQAVLYVQEHGKIANREFRTLTGIPDEGTRLELKRDLDRAIPTPRGKGRSAHYVCGVLAISRRSPRDLGDCLVIGRRRDG